MTFSPSVRRSSRRRRGSRNRAGGDLAFDDRASAAGAHIEPAIVRKRSTLDAETLLAVAGSRGGALPPPGCPDGVADDDVARRERLPPSRLPRRHPPDHAVSG